MSAAMLGCVTRLQPEEHPGDRLGRELSLLDLVMIVVASTIGAGIFLTPGQVAALLPSPTWIMLAWGAGALLSLAGAIANAELGAMFPRAGGNYVFLSEAFHPAAGFLVGWLTFFAIYAGTVAALASALAEGVGLRLGWSEQVVGMAGVAVILAVSGINMVSLRWGARANNFTTLFKLAALGAFVLLGPWLGTGETSRIWAPAEGEFSGISFARALSPVLFSYLGWNASIYVASEIRDPNRNLPRSLFLGLGVCALVYMLINGVYLYAIPMEDFRGIPDAGAAAGQALFGPIGGTLVGLFVLISVLGTLNATVLVGPRIPYAMALDGLFFGGTGKVHPTFGTPTVAIAVQAGVAVGLLLVLKNFPDVLGFTVFAVVLATMADVLALYRLRVTQPDRVRPYRAWGYPWVPGLYLLCNATIGLAMLWGSPFECLVGLAMLAAGIPFYFLFLARSGHRSQGRP
ncbi:MAG: amino acid permease [Myxococcota bacterium]